MATFGIVRWLKISLVIFSVCFILVLISGKKYMFQFHSFSTVSVPRPSIGGLHRGAEYSNLAVQRASSKSEIPHDQFRQRYNLMREVCHSLSAKETYNQLCNHVVENRMLGFSWCFVPKAGSTFWKQVFHVLERREKGDNSLTMSQIGFRETHYTHIRDICRFSNIEQMARYMSEMKTLLIVRNPYSRLFSAYIDKFFLPDHWFGVGRHIIKDYRRNATAFSRRCGHDVTFKEFIDYVIHVGETGNGSAWYHDDHWLPISKVCLPCQIPYKYIAKQETFASDRDYIFQQFGIKKYFHERLSWVESATITMSQRIEAFWLTGLQGGCLAERELMQRMWTAFQLQGYLPWNETLQSNVKNISRPVTKEAFSHIVVNTFKRYQNVSLKHQKVQGMIQAYITLSLSQMHKIQKVYDLDFKLFGYDKEPEDLFSFFSHEILNMKSFTYV